MFIALSYIRNQGKKTSVTKDVSIALITQEIISTLGVWVMNEGWRPNISIYLIMYIFLQIIISYSTKKFCMYIKFFKKVSNYLILC